MRVFGRRRTRLEAAAEDLAPVRRELARLDPWSFWVVALEPGGGASFAVVGTTGAYAVAVCGLKGYVVEERGRLLIDGHRVAGFREVRRAARALKGRLEVARTFTEVAPMICLARAAAGASRTHQGVRVVRLEDLVAEIAKRERTVDPSSAERGARRLGRVLSGSGGAVDE